MSEELEEKVVVWILIFCGFVFLGILTMVAISDPALVTAAVYGWALYHCYNNYLRRDDERQALQFLGERDG